MDGLRSGLEPGEGIRRWWEGGSYEATYVRHPGDGVWRIRRLEYRVVSRADYRRGGSWARPISVPAFAKLLPEDPAGPDRLAAPRPPRRSTRGR